MTDGPVRKSDSEGLNGDSLKLYPGDMPSSMLGLERSHVCVQINLAGADVVPL